MKKVILAALLSTSIVAAPLVAQEKKDMPMKGSGPAKESMPMKSDGMQGGGIMMGNMQEMHGKMMEMKRAWAA